VIDVSEEVAKVLESSRLTIAFIQNSSRYTTYATTVEGATNAERIVLFRGMARALKAMASNLEDLEALADK
jgi:hypothetical protein